MNVLIVPLLKTQFVPHGLKVRGQRSRRNQRRDEYDQRPCTPANQAVKRNQLTRGGMNQASFCLCFLTISMANSSDCS